MEFVKAPFQGILRLNAVSGMPVTAAAGRVLINERSDYLVTPTGPLNESAGAPGHLIFPYITDSTGYTTQFVLINAPGVSNVSGILHYLATDGSPLQVTALKLGSIQVVPFAGFNTPHAHAILRRIETTRACALPGVLAVLTAADYLADGLKPLIHSPFTISPPDITLRNCGGKPVFIEPPSLRLRS